MPCLQGRPQKFFLFFEIQMTQYLWLSHPPERQTTRVEIELECFIWISISCAEFFQASSIPLATIEHSDNVRDCEFLGLQK